MGILLTINRIMAIACTFFLGVLIEGLGYLRNKLKCGKPKRSCSSEEDETSTLLPDHSKKKQSMFARVMEAVAFGAQIFLLYCLMLVSMTYSLPLLLAITMGYTVGHLIFAISARSWDPEACGVLNEAPRCH